MNRLLQTASKSAASSLRINHATPSSSAVQFLTVRHFWHYDSTHNDQRESADKFANRYIKSSTSLSLDEEEMEFIQQHVDTRAQAKKDRNFETADKIRLDMKKRFNVTINDTKKLWSIGGIFAELGAKIGKQEGVYTRKCSGYLSAEDEDAISKILSDRYLAKKKNNFDGSRERNFDVADEIRDALMSTYNVQVDDRSNEWRVERDDYAMVGENTLSDEDVEYIDSKLKVRFSLKREKLYDDADAIRDELRGRFSVNVNDRTKEWRVDSQ